MSVEEKDHITSVQLRVSTLQRYKDLGRKGESYDAIFNRVLDVIKDHAPSRLRKLIREGF